MRALEPASLQLRFQARPEVARDLRDRLSIWLEEVGAAGDDVFEVLLAVTEAFANAVEHPREPSSRTIDVDGSIADHTVTVSVRDYGAWQAERQRSEGGLGFLLIGQLMDSVEVRPGADGTTVVMQRRLTGATGRRPGRASRGPADVTVIAPS
ncbi:MAG TPA: ATP-binding protein [Gaiellaceae bacterium]|jgi:anti-sigma regulatory factor (Ser/Thr protein kinase)